MSNKRWITGAITLFTLITAPLMNTRTAGAATTATLASQVQALAESPAALAVAKEWRMWASDPTVTAAASAAASIAPMTSMSAIVPGSLTAAGAAASAQYIAANGLPLSGLSQIDDAIRLANGVIATPAYQWVAAQLSRLLADASDADFQALSGLSAIGLDAEEAGLAAPRGQCDEVDCAFDGVIAVTGAVAATAGAVACVAGPTCPAAAIVGAAAGVVVAAVGIVKFFYDLFKPSPPTCTATADISYSAPTMSWSGSVTCSPAASSMHLDLYDNVNGQGNGFLNGNSCDGNCPGTLSVSFSNSVPSGSGCHLAELDWLASVTDPTTHVVTNFSGPTYSSNAACT